MVKNSLACRLMAALITIFAGTGAMAQTSAPEQGMATAAPGVGADYVVGPGDEVQVFVWRNPELTVIVPVRPDGKISTPLNEDMPAVGKTPAQLGRDIEKVLSEYVKSPQVNIIVTKPASAFSQIKVIGQVLHPSSVPYREGMTVLDAVLAAGGMTTFAAGNRAHVARIENGKEISLKVKLDALVNDGDMSQNLPLRPGDVLVVPQSRF